MPKNITNITGVSLCQKTGIIRIFRSTIKELGDPKYIRFLFLSGEKNFGSSGNQ